ncbi:tRNA-dependent cyclodipeptide synthase [Streptomyces yaizuensis]|uniref:Cyclodipeptide synthase n=1 Tax=Streptomyces yaizuensis TaxID=2989713 RepID=A0ABQ5PAK4_9ACTN|nr:tRNA-dependent cyclodipeptide synthase [Streptomyces sp. YSPA8]GLF99624.1 tRNA-dependent cyclodipeptide synthase [Streptomyces sp. YSPA8]
MLNGAQHDSRLEPTEWSHGMYVEPYSERCRGIWHRGEHALIGVSAGNSYFSQDRLARLLAWADKGFAQVDLVYVDTHIDTMLIADGHSPAAAAKSARGTLKDLRRRIRRAVEGAAVAPGRLRVRALTELLDEPRYRSVRARTDQALREEPEFAAVVDQMVGEVIRHRIGGERPATASRLEAGREYVAAEAPLFMDAPAVFGVPSSVTCYHMPTPLQRYLVRPDSAVRAAAGHAHLVVRPPEPVRAAAS